MREKVKNKSFKIEFKPKQKSSLYFFLTYASFSRDRWLVTLITGATIASESVDASSVSTKTGNDIAVVDVFSIWFVTTSMRTQKKKFLCNIMFEDASSHFIFKGSLTYRFQDEDIPHNHRPSLFHYYNSTQPW